MIPVLALATTMFAKIMQNITKILAKFYSKAHGKVSNFLFNFISNILQNYYRPKKLSVKLKLLKLFLVNNLNLEIFKNL